MAAGKRIGPNRNRMIFESAKWQKSPIKTEKLGEHIGKKTRKSVDRESCSTWGVI